MAEFQEVMNQWKRMCSTYDNCVQCPLKHCISPRQSNWTMSFDAERIIMDWAVEHPEPVYPTWGEWLEKVIPHGNGETALTFAVYAMRQPIPENIAKKLGLEPKEV